MIFDQIEDPEVDSLATLIDLLDEARGFVSNPERLDDFDLSPQEMAGFKAAFKARGLNLPEKCWMVVYPGFRAYCLAQTRDDAVALTNTLGKVERIVQVYASEEGEWNPQLATDAIVERVVKVESIPP